jgi:hypothetical protein
MKRMIKLGTMGVLLALGSTQARAATTNYWVQNVNLALTAYVQVGGQIVSGSLPTKQFIAFLSGAANPALISSQTPVAVTNQVYTNLFVEVTNFWLLPITQAPPGDLPRSYTVTTNYVVTPDGGLTRYTNNIQFTNDVLVNRIEDTNVIYSFHNLVTVPTHGTAYLFPELPSEYLRAVWTNHVPGTVFVLSGPVPTDVPGWTTNYTYAKNPEFTKLPGAKLLYITPVVAGTNLPSKYVVRYRDGGKNIDTDVSALLGEPRGSPYYSVSQALPGGAVIQLYAFSEIDFDNHAGTSVRLIGFDTQVWGALTSKGSVVSPSVLKQRKMAVGNDSGFLTGSVQDRTFKGSPVIVKGTISISGGKIE